VVPKTPALGKTKYSEKTVKHALETAKNPKRLLKEKNPTLYVNHEQITEMDKENEPRPKPGSSRQTIDGKFS